MWNNCYSPDICEHGKNSPLDHQMYLMDFPGNPIHFVPQVHQMVAPVYISGIENEPTFGQVLSSNNHLNTTRTTVNYYTTDTVDNYLSTESQEFGNNAHGAENVEDLLRLTGMDFSSSMFNDNVKNEGVAHYDKLPYFANYDTVENECRNIALGMF